MANKVRVPWRQRYRTSKAIFRQGMRMMASERDLWRFPILAAVIFVPVMIVAAVAGWLGIQFLAVPPALAPFIGLLLLPLFYPFAVLASVLQAALVFGLHERMEGRTCTPGKAWARAKSCWRPIARFNVVALLVAGLLQFVGIILDKLHIVPWVGQVTQAIGNLAWAAAAFFVIPILVVEEEQRALGALKRSVQVARSQWGKAVAGIVTITLALVIPFMLVLMGLMWMGIPLALMAGPVGMVATWVLMGALVLFLMGAMMVLSTAAQSAYQTALYRYARTGQVSAPFDQGTLVDAWAPYRAG